MMPVTIEIPLSSQASEINFTPTTASANQTPVVDLSMFSFSTAPAAERELNPSRGTVPFYRHDV